MTACYWVVCEGHSAIDSLHIIAMLAAQNPSMKLLLKYNLQIAYLHPPGTPECMPFETRSMGAILPCFVHGHLGACMGAAG